MAKHSKRMQKWISGILAVITVLVPALSLTAGALETKRSVPNIDVHGFGAAPLFADKDDPASPQIWPVDGKAIYEARKRQIPELYKLGRKGDWVGFAELVSKIIRDSMFPIYIGEDGEVHDNSGVHLVYPDPQDVRMDGEYHFQYDWRTDPVEIAASLNDYINYILEHSGSDKVTIECHSMGGIVVTTYLAIYGNEKIKSAAFNSTAVYGFSAAARMMSGDVKFDATALEEYLFFVFDYNEYNHLINGLVMAAKQIGLLDLVANQSNEVFSLIGAIVAKESIIPMFGNWPSIWALVPNEDYEKAYDNVFNKVYAGEDHSALIEKIESFNDMVRYKKTDILKDLNEKANVYVICRYGYSSAPVSSDYEAIGDGIIDAKYSSFGATTSLYGQSLDPAYLAEIPPKYIAPNKSVDASTCLFPEQTWFVYSMKHFKSPEPLSNFIDLLLMQEEQKTVTDMEEYPRFMAYDAIENKIGPDNNNYSMTVFRRVLIGIGEFFRWFWHLFKRK